MDMLSKYYIRVEVIEPMIPSTTWDALDIEGGSCEGCGGTSRMMVYKYHDYL
jgi:hypothetical protein